MLVKKTLGDDITEGCIAFTIASLAAFGSHFVARMMTPCARSEQRRWPREEGEPRDRHMYVMRAKRMHGLSEVPRATATGMRPVIQNDWPRTSRDHTEE